MVATNKTTSEETPAGPLDGTEELRLAIAGGNYKTTTQEIADLAPSGFTNPMTTKGDLIVGGNAGVATRLGVGSNGQAFVADSTQTLGVKWASTAPPYNPQVGTAYTLVITDASPSAGWAGIVSMSNAAANVLTVPLHATVAFPTGTSIQIPQLGAGKTSVIGSTAGSGVTLRTASSLSARTQYSSIILTYIGNDVWLVGGDTT